MLRVKWGNCESFGWRSFTSCFLVGCKSRTTPPDLRFVSPRAGKNLMFSLWMSFTCVSAHGQPRVICSSHELSCECVGQDQCCPFIWILSEQPLQFFSAHGKYNWQDGSILNFPSFKAEECSCEVNSTRETMFSLHGEWQPKAILSEILSARQVPR